jgi:hypothetical protein
LKFPRYDSRLSGVSGPDDPLGRLKDGLTLCLLSMIETRRLMPQ